MQKQNSKKLGLLWEDADLDRKEQTIDELSKTLPEILTERELVKRGFYQSLQALRREWKLRINCPAHKKNSKGEFYCTRKDLIQWLQTVLKETGMLHHHSPTKQNNGVTGPTWVQLELPI